MRRYASAVVAFLFAGALVQSATAILALPGVPGTPRAYPWKKNIATTVFWIGPASGAPVHQESWKPEARMNPFYVALPFNDLQYPKLTKKWLPGAWTPRRQEDGRPTSACQNRWVEIKNGDGRICFAQWEDVGPIDTDDVPYVFGSARPRANRGLDVSPAVAKYLGFDRLAITSWRFVDDADVKEGLWLDYQLRMIALHPRGSEAGI